MPQTRFDNMTISALAEPGRQLAILDAESHTDALVRKQFRSAFRSYWERFPHQRFPLLAERCPFCDGELLTCDHCSRSMASLDEDWDEEPDSRGWLQYCRNCRYWRFYHTETDTFPRGVGLTLQYTGYASKLHEYETKLPDGLSDEFARWVRRHPKAWHQMSPRRFERLVADVFRLHHGQARVIHVGQPDDGGVDVLLVESDGLEWLIQAKRRENPSSSEGVSTVRNLLGAMVLNGANHGAVVSTADHFTYRAFQAVGRAAERGMTVRLIEKRAIDRMLDLVLPDRPWLGSLRDSFPEFAQRFADRIDSDRQLMLF